jgi:hypothetical protein
MKPPTTARLLLVTVIVAACTAGPVELIVRGQGPDGCRYEGPSQIAEGPVEFGASPSGDGRISAAIREVRSSDGEAVDSDLGRIVARVEMADGVNLATSPADLAAGEYAITCHYQEFDGVVATLTVSP